MKTAKEAEHYLLTRLSQLRAEIRDVKELKTIDIETYVESLEDQMNIISDLVQYIRMTDFNLT